MAAQVHKLAALRMLDDDIRKLEGQRQKRIDEGGASSEIDRQHGQLALTAVVKLLSDQGVETRPLVRILAELAALSAGAAPSAILTPAATRHRRPTAPVIESVKGRLAAIMEFQQQSGFPRKLAAQWVVQHLPSDMKHKLGKTSRTTVDSWLVKWGGHHGAAPGNGREGYLHMREILSTRRPTETQLLKIVETLGRWLPS